MSWKLRVGALLCSCVLGTASVAQERENVIMVLDGSGSMWGQIDGVTKIEIAREAIAEMVSDWDENTNLGLIAYGHREKGNCGDIEALLTPGPVNADAFTRTVNSVSPKGKTPISASVRQAAEAMRFTENKATVILISDGLETCDADPCALATELEEAGVDFTAHVIGFDLNENDAPQLACLAENSGGQFLSASNASELSEAVQTTVQVVAEPEPVVVVEATPEPEPEPEPASQTGMRLTGILCADCEPITDDLFWWYYDPAQDAQGNRQELGRNGNARPVIETEARDFFIVGRYGDAFASQEITVSAGELTDVVVNFNAGHFRVNAAATEGADPFTDNMFYWVYENRKDIQGNRKEVSRAGAPSHLFRLPAGEYYVVARHGDAFANEVITVLPGELTELTFDMNVGYLRTNAVSTEGAAVLNDEMFYWVYEDKKDLEGNRKEVTRAGAPSHLFRLPAGTYHIVARHGNAFSSDTVEVSANSLTEYQFDMNVGYLRTAAVAAEGGPALTDDVFYWVYHAKKDLEGNRKELTRAGAPTHLFRLPAGEYVVVTRHGKAFSEVPITVTAGALEEVTAVQNSGTIRVSASMADGSALAADTFWVVLDAKKDLEGNRREFDRAGAKQHTFILPAGEYVLSVRNAGDWHETPISIAPGDETPVQVSIE